MSTYLLHGVLVAGLGLALLAFPTRQRGVALASGFAAAPMGLLDVLFVRDYWHPDHVIAAWFSVEGLLFSFGNGILLWLLASWPIRHQLPAAMPMRDFAMPMLRFGGVAMALILALWHDGLGLTPLGLMPATLVTLGLLAVFILARAPDLLWLALWGSAGFALLYAAQLLAMRGIDVGYPELWGAHFQADQRVLGFPVEEFVWAAIYGATWPLCVARSLAQGER